MNILAYATRAVATHLGFRAVGVENPHFEIRAVGRTDEDDTISSDSFMAIAKEDGKCFRIFRGAVGTIDVDVIVSDAMHLGETKLVNSG